MTSDAEIRPADETIRNLAHHLVMQIVGHFHSDERQINEIITVPLTVFARMVRNHDATVLLLKNSHPTEAAVLSLTQFELRLDLVLAAADIGYAGRWMDHLDMKWSVENVSKKIARVAAGPVELKRMKGIFECLSGIKHGNPIYSELAFPVRIDAKMVTISTGEIDDHLAEMYTQALCDYADFQLAWGAQAMNKFTAKFATVDKELRAAVRDQFVRAKPAEEKFLTFCRDLSKGRKGYLGVRGIMKR